VAVETVGIIRNEGVSQCERFGDAPRPEQCFDAVGRCGTHRNEQRTARLMTTGELSMSITRSEATVVASLPRARS
jgi:hypothetical protein